MRPMVRLSISLAALVLCLGAGGTGWCDEPPLSEATEGCLMCHEALHPGIVEGWRAGRHAAITPGQAMEAEGLALKVSSTDVPEELRGVAVGCAECHNLRADAHADTFDHNGKRVHVVVTPDDCAVCHATEVKQYSRNIMSHARANLVDNPVYQMLQRSILGTPSRAHGGIELAAEDDATAAEACSYCHGTKLEVTGTEVRETDIGELEFPVIAGWPNQGSGRANPDGSLGSCTACHTRHVFSMAMARKPHTCKECHVGPDVPAYKVYSASKHGNIYESLGHGWNFDSTPWTIGEDFTAPTCAVCHMSLVTQTDGQVVNERSHEMKDRLSWRIFGLIYAHPQPKSPDTTIIRNKDGLPLPTAFDGTPAAEFLLGAEERQAHTKTMQATCLACHGTSWVEGHWRRYENTIETTNASILTATTIMGDVWGEGLASGVAADASPFDESVERRWSDAWLFYANTVRFASAMAGGGDYGVFANGRYELSKAVADLHDWLEHRRAVAGATGGK